MTVLHENTVIVFMNFMTNMCLLSLERMATFWRGPVGGGEGEGGTGNIGP